MTQEEMQVIRSMMEEVVDSKLGASEQRMSQMMDEKIEPLKIQMNVMQAQMSTMQEDIVQLKEDVAEIREDTAITRTATNTLVEWADDVAVITQIKFPVKKAK